LYDRQVVRDPKVEHAERMTKIDDGGSRTSNKPSLLQAVNAKFATTRLWRAAHRRPQRWQQDVGDATNREDKDEAADKALACKAGIPAPAMFACFL
jgi:hypothetical protein